MEKHGDLNLSSAHELGHIPTAPSEHVLGNPSGHVEETKNKEGIEVDKDVPEEKLEIFLQPVCQNVDSTSTTLGSTEDENMPIKGDLISPNNSVLIQTNLAASVVMSAKAAPTSTHTRSVHHEMYYDARSSIVETFLQPMCQQVVSSRVNLGITDYSIKSCTLTNSTVGQPSTSTVSSSKVSTPSIKCETAIGSPNPPYVL